MYSGHSKTAPEAVGQLLAFYKHLREIDSSIQLLIGSGINSDTISPLLEGLRPDWHVREVHLSGGEWVEGVLTSYARKGGMGMGASKVNEWKVWKTSEKKVAGVLRYLTESANV